MAKDFTQLFQKRIGSLRYRFGQCSDSSFKQVALRRLREAKQLASSNPLRAAECLSIAESFLPQAEAVHARNERRRTDHPR
jgi:hypothetical protein